MVLVAIVDTHHSHAYPAASGFRTRLFLCKCHGRNAVSEHIVAYRILLIADNLISIVHEGVKG